MNEMLLLMLTAALSQSLMETTSGGVVERKEPDSMDYPGLPAEMLLASNVFSPLWEGGIV